MMYSCCVNTSKQSFQTFNYHCINIASLILIKTLVIYSYNFRKEKTKVVFVSQANHTELFIRVIISTQTELFIKVIVSTQTCFNLLPNQRVQLITLEFFLKVLITIFNFYPLKTIEENKILFLPRATNIAYSIHNLQGEINFYFKTSK